MVRNYSNHKFDFRYGDNTDSDLNVSFLTLEKNKVVFSFLENKPKNHQKCILHKKSNKYTAYMSHLINMNIITSCPVGLWWYDV